MTKLKHYDNDEIIRASATDGSLVLQTDLMQNDKQQLTALSAADIAQWLATLSQRFNGGRVRLENVVCKHFVFAWVCRHQQKWSNIFGRRSSGSGTVMFPRPVVCVTSVVGPADGLCDLTVIDGYVLATIRTQPGRPIDRPVKLLGLI